MQPFSIQEGSGECRSTKTLGAEHVTVVTADPHLLAGSQPEDSGVTRLCTSSSWKYYDIDLKQISGYIVASPGKTAGCIHLEILILYNDWISIRNKLH